GPEHLVKNGDANGSAEAQRIQQGKMVLHGSVSYPWKRSRCRYRNSFTDLVEVGHTPPPVGSMAQM
ncbi:hypothetical protein, partial [Klebsiella oxytoca]|uniref:hypothetical protein n=1 Tax=Klebsiella oxytoca TaxID=571 RepID=UPI0019543194